MLVVQCPNPQCARSLRVAEQHVSQKVRCVHCGTDFSLQGESRVRHAAARQASPRSSEGGAAAIGDDGRPAAAKGTMDRRALSTDDSAAPGGSPPDVPRQVGRFQVRALLGAGAFGAVYRAYDPQLDREVALKVLHAGADDARRTQRFLREARSAARLRHPHIVPVYDAGQDGGLLYIAAAYIPGRTLADAIDEEPFDFRRTAGVVRELAEALAYAHGFGVVHRDVKPANILLDEHGGTHLADFGLAYRPDAPDADEDGWVVGTPAYMAPEQAQGRNGLVRAAGDQYSLGVVLYELLCGRTPFSGPSDVLLYNHIRTPPDPPRQIRPDLPPDLEAICLKAMAKRPGDRYADCGTMADDLRRWLEGEPIKARRMPLAERLGRWCRREPKLALMGATALCLLIAVAVVSTVSYSRQIDLTRQATTATATTALALQEIQREKDATDAALEEVRNQKEALDDLLTKLKAEQGATKAALAALEGKKTDLEKSKTDLEGKKTDLEKSNTQLEVDRYFHLTTLAGHALGENNMDRAGVILNDLKGSREQLHGWEWSYLNEEYARRAGELKNRQDVANSFAGRRLNGDWVLARAEPGKDVKVLQLGRGKAFELPDTDDVVCVAFSPDGRRLATAGGRRQVRVWNVENLEKELKDTTAFNHDGMAAVRCVAFSPDPAGARLASGDDDGTVMVWDAGAARGAKPLRTLKPPTPSEAHCLAMTPTPPDAQPQFLFSAGADGVVTAWRTDRDAAPNTTVLSMRGYSAVAVGMTIDSKGRPTVRGALAHEEGPIDVLRLGANGEVEPETTLEGFGEKVYGLAFSADGSRVAASGAKSVKVWEGVKLLRTIRTHDSRFAFFPDGGSVVVPGAAGSLAAWSVLRGTKKQYADDGKPVDASEKLALDGYDRHVVGVAYVPEGTRLFSAAGVPGEKKTDLAAGELRAWNAATGEEEDFFQGAKEPLPQIACIACSPGPDHPFLAGAFRDGTVRVWNLRTGLREADVLPGPRQHDDEAWSVAFRPEDGAFLVSAGKDGNVKVWDVQNHLLKTTLRAKSGAAVNCVAFSRDGKSLASAAADGVVTVWDATNWTEAFHFNAHAPAPAYAVAFSPDGALLATGGEDRLVKVWDLSNREDVKKGKAVHTLRGHTGAVGALAFNSDGVRLASASEDRTVCVWDVTTGLETLSLQGDARFSFTLTFSPDGKRLTTGGVDGVKSWDARAAEK